MIENYLMQNCELGIVHIKLSFMNVAPKKERGNSGNFCSLLHDASSTILEKSGSETSSGEKMDT